MFKIMRIDRRAWVGAEKMLTKCVPDLYNYKTILYVGASVKRHQLIPEFYAHDYMIDLLEIWESNTRHFRCFKSHLFREIILGDVRDADMIISKTYDIVVWWQGPEHINRNELEDTLNKLCKMAIYFVLIACPWGRRFQDVVRGNLYERHLACLYPKDFEELGWEGCAVGERDERNSYMIAWKRRRLLKE